MDLDGDGHADLLSGSWPGEIFFFRGGPGRAFAAPVKLRDRFGKAINIGGGRFDSKDEILFVGDATFEKNARGRTVIRYEGTDIEVPEGKRANIGGTASSVHAIDWNADGKVDLLVGDVEGRVYLVPKEARGKGIAFGKAEALRAGGKVLEVPDGHAGPFAADWDGDGKLDLLVGAGDGSVWFYRNVGTAREPKLAAGHRLVGPGEANQGPEAAKRPRRGVRAKICVVDYEGDGRLDLLVGDYARHLHPEPTARQKGERAEARKNFDALIVQLEELEGKLSGPDAIKGRVERDKVEARIRALRKRGVELHEVAAPRGYEHHGWVWLFQRKPAKRGAHR